MSPVLAYLDAGSGALLVQLIVGGAAGVAAFARFRWRMIRGEVDHLSDQVLDDVDSVVAQPETQS